MVPALRVRARNHGKLRPGGAHVVYWMTAFRRVDDNFAFDRALDHARALGKPLLVFEAIRTDYPWACDRFHSFVIDGMRDTAARLEGTGVAYHPYVEPARGAGKGLLEALARDACVVVADEYPCFFLPRMLDAAAERLGGAHGVLVESVDSNGLLPLRAAPRVFERAFDFRRHLQKELPAHLADVPRADALEGARPVPHPGLDAKVRARWPAADARLLAGDRALLASLPIDHGVAPVAYAGGARAGRAAIERFLQVRLARYATERNVPDVEAASGLSPYLHWGHVSPHTIWRALTDHEDWSAEKIAPKPTGVARGFWNMSPEAEAFVDELVTWRELGFNFCARRDDTDRYTSLPAWARDTLADHARDPRPHLYTLAQFEDASTHDPLWNAAQRQLVREGRIHNYLRMLWGKKILEWSRTAEDALAVMIELNNKYAVDGRDPSSYSGIFWVLGRYDRPWPERAIYGTIRCMTSDSTRKKVSVDAYLRRFGSAPAQGAFDL